MRSSTDSRKFDEKKTCCRPKLEGGKNLQKKLGARPEGREGVNRNNYFAGLARRSPQQTTTSEVGGGGIGCPRPCGRYCS